MKKLILFLFSTTLLTSQVSQAGYLFESKYTEPIIFAAIASVAVISAAPKQDPLQMGALGAAAGFAFGYGINSYYDSKYGTRYIKDMNDLDKTIQQYRMRDAQRAARKDMTTPFGIIKQEVVPAQDLGNGQISSPYIIETHTIPGNNDSDFLGD